MKLYEHEGKSILDAYGILTPKRILITKPQQAKDAQRKLGGKDVVLKAQVRTGKRGKAGAIRIVSATDATRAAAVMLRTRVHGETPAGVLIEEKVTIAQELYIAVTIDAATRSRVVLFSKTGGVDVEELSRTYPRAVIKEPIKGFAVPTRVRSSIMQLPRASKLLGIIKRLIELAANEDALLAEINPLAQTPTGYVAIDAKIITDDNALFRHPKPRYASDLSPAEKKAAKAGLHYVDLDGDIAVIGNGAGLVMATLDMIDSYGGRPANFLDIQGGTGADMMRKAIDLCLRKPGIKGIFVNIFAGITDCEEIAKGIVTYRKKHRIRQPLVVRMTGRNERIAKAMLKRNGVCLAETMDEGARTIIQKVNA